MLPLSNIPLSLLPLLCQLPASSLHTLLLGGFTSPSLSYSPSLEVVTPSTACPAPLPSLPVSRSGAGAALLDSSLFYCGGYGAELPCFFSS